MNFYNKGPSRRAQFNTGGLALVARDFDKGWNLDVLLGGRFL
jgi:hypothetical protein